MLEKINDQFKALMQSIYGSRLDKVVLYGSYARGDFREDSDIDFLVVLKDEKINTFQEIRETNEQIYDLSLHTSKLISFLPTTLKKYQSYQNPLYINVRNEGIII